MKNSKFLKLASFTLASLVLARCFCATPVCARSSDTSIFTSIPKFGIKAALGVLGVGLLAGVLAHLGSRDNSAEKILPKNPRNPDLSVDALIYDYKPRLEISRCPILDYGDESLDSDSDVDSETDEPYSDYDYDYDYEQDGNNGEPSLWDVLSQHRDYPVPEDPKNKPEDDLFRDVDNALMRFV